jgi:hypothetical protein
MATTTASDRSEAASNDEEPIDDQPIDDQPIDDRPIDDAMPAQLQQQQLSDRGRRPEELRRENEEHAGADSYSNLVNAVPDPGDAAVASEQAELRQVEAALGRIDDGSHGVCSMCGRPCSGAAAGQSGGRVLHPVSVGF